MFSEFDLIEQLRQQISVTSSDIVCGIGDDCAVMRQSEGSWLLATTDCHVEGVHFRWEYATPAQVGARVMAVNLSDIAAMGGTPRYALVDLRIPPKFPEQKISDLYDGLIRMAGSHGVTVVGGNTSSAPHEFSVAVTLLGEISPAKCKFRKGAKPGDLIYLTGPVGAAALGLAALRAGERNTIFTQAHLQPRPHVKEGMFLGSRPEVTSLIDVSDGLSLDLSHVLDQSGAGADLAGARIPNVPNVQETARALKLDPLELSLTGGEDYVLLATVRHEAKKIFEDEMSKHGFAFSSIGEIKSEKGIFVDGKSFVARGYEHLKN